MNPYLVLGVDEDVSDTNLKKRYKTVCKMFHPDKHEDDKSAKVIFQILQDAYEKIKLIRKKIVIEDVVIEQEEKKKERKEEKKRKQNKEEVVIPGTNITESDIKTLGQLNRDPWFHPDFNLTDYFGSDCFPGKKK